MDVHMGKRGNRRPYKTQELNISSVDHVHSGKYSCTGQTGNKSSQRSDAVTLTVSGEFVWCVDYHQCEQLLSL